MSVIMSVIMYFTTLMYSISIQYDNSIYTELTISQVPKIPVLVAGDRALRTLAGD